MRSLVLKRKPVLLLNHTIVSNVVLMVFCTEFNKLLVKMKFFIFSSIVPVGFVMSLSKLSSWGPTPGAVGGFGGGGGGSEDNGASGRGDGYSGRCGGTHAKQAGGGGSSYRNGTDFSGLTGGNSNDSLCTNK